MKFLHSNVILLQLALSISSFPSVILSWTPPLWSSSSTLSENGIRKPPHPQTPPKDSPRTKQIQLEQEQEARLKHPELNEVFNALFVSVPERPNPTPIINLVSQESGTRPHDFPAGAFLRLGPNGASEKDGWMDGDGMIHCVTFPPGSEDDNNMYYSSTYVDTKGRQLEQERGGTFIGSLGSAPDGLPLLGSVFSNMLKYQLGTKDTCNTALAVHGGKVLSCMEQARPSEIEIGKDGSIKTIQTQTNLNGAIPKNDPITGGTLSAHGKTCSNTGERIHVSYSSSEKPFARVDVFYDPNKTNDGGWTLKESIPIDDIDVPVMIHDCAITENYVVILDFPLTIRPTRMFQNRFPVEYEPENGARIGLVPRNKNKSSKTNKVQWFDCDPGVILHTVNAYEETNEKDGATRVVLHALRSEPTGSKSYITTYTTAFLHEWVLDVTTGTLASEECLNAEEMVEFPIIDERLLSTSCFGNNGPTPDSCYAVGVQTIGGPLNVYKTPNEGILLDRVVKFALSNDGPKNQKKGNVIGRFDFPDGWYAVTEPTIVPREEDGSVYVMVVGTKIPVLGNNNRVPSKDSIANDNVALSRVFVLDGDNLNDGSVWEFDLPYHVPYGLHSAFLQWKHMK